MEHVDLGPDDATDLRDLYAEYQWWDDRDVESVREALANTHVAVGLRVEGALVASARVVSDGVYYAKCDDVIVAADRRGEGVGAVLLDAIVEHPDLAELSVELTARKGLVPFYERAGFERYDLVTDVAGEEEPFVHLVYWREQPPAMV